MKDIAIEYQNTIQRLNEALDYANRYKELCAISDGSIGYENKILETKVLLLESIGETIEPDSPYLGDIRNGCIYTHEAMIDEIIESIKHDIFFIEKGLSYVQHGNHHKQASFIEPTNEKLLRKKTFDRQDYRNATIYVFRTNAFGVAKKPTFTFQGLDDCAQFFKENIKEAKDSKDVRGSIWKAIKDSSKGKKMFGYRFSLNEDLNK